MSSPLAFFVLAAMQTPAPPLVLPPQSVPPAAMLPSGQLVRGPRETGPASRYVSRDDYPAAAVGTRAQGLVRFTLTIDPGGRVIGCVITQSSGSSVLDSATCNIMRRRARYAPAMDANGNPVAGTIDQQLAWKLP